MSTVKLVSFSDANKALDEGKKIARYDWLSTGVYLVQINVWDSSDFPNNDYVTKMPFIAIKTTNNKLIPWTITTEAAIADDWVILE